MIYEFEKFLSKKRGECVTSKQIYRLCLYLNKLNIDDATSLYKDSDDYETVGQWYDLIMKSDHSDAVKSSVKKTVYAVALDDKGFDVKHIFNEFERILFVGC